MSLLALVAVEMMQPKPSSSQPWLSMSDYPANALRGGERGQARLRALISASGQVENCSIEQTSGHPDLDVATCTLFRKRAQFQPATDQDGQPVAAVARQSVNWNPPNTLTKFPKSPADIVLTVSGLPTGSDDAPRLLVKIMVGADGKIEACQSNSSKYSPAFGSVACKQVEETWHPLCAIGQTGKAERSLQAVTVEFKQ